MAPQAGPPTAQNGWYNFYTYPTTPWGAHPRTRLVTYGGWDCAIAHDLRGVLDHRPAVGTKYTLSAHRPGGHGAVLEVHALDGTTYSTYEAAKRAAYEAGILQYMVRR